MYRLDESKQAAKDYETAKRSGHGKKLDEILTVIERAPYEPTPGHHFERLAGNLKGYCSRRVDHHNRIMYKVLPNNESARDEDGNLYEGIVQVFRAWEHIYKKPKR